MRVHCTNSLSHEHISTRATLTYSGINNIQIQAPFILHIEGVLKTETAWIKTRSLYACLELKPHESRQEARSKEAKKGGPLIFWLPRTNCRRIRPYILPGSSVLRGFACVRTKVLTPSVLGKEEGVQKHMQVPCIKVIIRKKRAEKRERKTMRLGLGKLWLKPKG